MTTVPPSAPSGAPVGFFPYRIPTYNNIQPFTYKAGMTYLDKLEDLTEWLVKYLTPYIDDTISEYADAFNEALTKFNEGTVAFQAWVLEQKGEFQGKIDEFEQLVTDSTNAFNSVAAAAMTAITAKVGEADAARVKAEAARDLAEQYAAQAGTKADNTIAAFFGDLASATYAAVVSVINSVTATPILAKSRARISVTHKLFSINGKSIPYAVTRMAAGGFMPRSSGIVEKRFASDFDVSNPTATGTAFKPPGESIDSYARRRGATVVANASGWNVTNNVGEMRGIQMRDGKVFHDFEGTNLAGSPAGLEGLGLHDDGRLRCYSALRGDTKESMIAAGVKDAWSYGPNLIVDGVGQDLTLKNWQYFLTEYSARTIIGQTSYGDVLIISTVGKTNVIGISGNEMVQLAQREGLYNASVFDGGGSTQLYAGGLYSIPSSDDNNGYDKTFGRRKVGDAFLLRGELVTSPLDTGWRDIPLRSGFVAYNGQTPQVRSLNGVTEVRGTVAPSSGAFGSDAAVFGDLPQQFGHETSAKSYVGVGNGDNIRKVTVQSDRSMQVVGSASSSPIYIALEMVRWGNLGV